MKPGDDSRRPRRRIDAAAKAHFLAALRRGARREEAAAGAGFSLTGFYGARRRDPSFRADWAAALAATPARRRRARAYAGRGEVRIAPANRRLWQRRRRYVRFDARAQAVFLAHFAAHCDTRAAAAAAGVSESTVTRHCRIDPVFAAEYAEALAQGYAWLEAEALRQRLAAQKKLRAAIAAGCDNPPRARSWRGTAEGGGGVLAPEPAVCPRCGTNLSAEAGAEFDRIMKLLARWDRKPRRAERGFAPGGRRQRWTFDQAIALLARRMRALGLHPAPPKAEDDAGG